MYGSFSQILRMGSICVVYLVSGFFMFALHAKTLDAPTLVVQEYQEHFLKKVRLDSRNPTASGEKVIRAYLIEHMKEVPALKAARLSKLIYRLSKQHDLPAGLILSVIRVESNFQPWAVSSRGALGLMQIMPETGQWIAERYGMPWEGPTDLLDEEINIRMGVRYLAFLRDRYDGNLKRMLSAYNRGPAKVDEEVAVGRNGTLDYYHKIRQYLPKMALGNKLSQNTHVD